MSAKAAPGSRVDRSGVSEPARRELEAVLRTAMRGEVDFGSAVRAAYSSDSSNYRQVPLGVVFPRDHDDVVTALRVAADHDAPVLARGAGTSLAGQACNVAVVVDTSRHLTRILEIDEQARTARVQPGVVLDDLRRAATRHGLTFGPDPATHAWCTLGGMIGNNSCGPHALYAGKTVDNVDALRVVLYGGESLEVGDYDDVAYAEAVAAGGRLAGVLAGLREIGRRSAADVVAAFPDIPRRVSGYNLDQIVPGRPLHVARLLVGTESTCAVVTEATVRLSSNPGHRRLVVLAYPDVFAAAAAVPSLLDNAKRQPSLPQPSLPQPSLPQPSLPQPSLPQPSLREHGLREHGLLGLEGFDAALTEQMRARGLHTDHLGLLPDGGAWLLAEVGADDPDEADALAAAVAGGSHGAQGWRRYDDVARQAAVWSVRESGLAATAIRADGSHNVEGWEDAAVPPERLAEYLRGITSLWQEFGYSGAWYGHFGQGCVHTRNNFDLAGLEGLRAYRSYVERAADLVVALGGSISGEHGDGQSRGELLERVYGPAVVTAFRQVKAVFDPRGRMNPGKVVDPYPLDTNLRFGPDHPHRGPHADPGPRPSGFSFAADGGSLQSAAQRCVGVGRCRRDDAGVMCPSYRATRDERHSTRGRASLLTEMFRGEVTPASWRNEDVRAALDLCLSCKGCLVDCPTHVDMATYKAEFLSHYFRGRLRPPAMYALGLIPWTARAATRAPRFANAVLASPPGRGLRRLVGVTTRRAAPAFADPPLRRSARAGAGRRTRAATVVVWPDTFTDAYRPQAAHDLVAVLEALGEQVAIPTRWACCARPLYDSGMLALARRWLTRLLDVLQPWLDAGVPVVVPEPSCLAAFRDELPALMAGDARAARLASLARSPAEHLLSLDALEAAVARAAGGPAGRRVVVHPHCHARAAGSSAADGRLLELLGYDVQVLDAGCCGLAGSFGFRAEHEELSRRIGLDQWMPRLLDAVEDADALVVDGFSCLTQLAELAGTAGLRTAPQPLPLVSLVRRRLGV